MWAVLPPECRTVWTTGEPDLEAILAAAGLELSPSPEGVDAVVADLEDGRVPPDLKAAAAALGEGGTLAVAVRGGPRELGVGGSKAKRALELLATPAGALVARRDARRAANALGGPLEHVPTGDRAPIAGIGAAALRASASAPAAPRGVTASSSARRGFGTRAGTSRAPPPTAIATAAAGPAAPRIAARSGSPPAQTVRQSGGSTAHTQL